MAIIEIRDDGDGNPDTTDPAYPTPGPGEHVVNLGEDLGAGRVGVFRVEVRIMTPAELDAAAVADEAQNTGALAAVARELLRLKARGG